MLLFYSCDGDHAKYFISDSARINIELFRLATMYTDLASSILYIHAMHAILYYTDVIACVLIIDMMNDDY